MPLKRPSPIPHKSAAAQLLAWYDAHARVLPWRAPPGEAPDPYRVWLSEVMLQQTTVATVRPRFEAWVARWPDFASLAAADEGEVMAAWAGLGYYARARNLVAAARVVTAEHGGRFPDTEEALRALPGLGAYTAAAVAAIAFGRRAVVVDANVERVVARLAAIDVPLPGGRVAIRAAADALTPELRAGDFAQGMMDLGSGICTPRRPRCLLCPLREACAGFATGQPERFPVKAKRAERQLRYGTVFWVERMLNGSNPILPDPTPILNGPKPVHAELVEALSCLSKKGSPSTSSGRTGEGAPTCEPTWGRSSILLVRRPPKGLLGGMRALPTGPWVDAPPGLAGAPVDADWRLLPGTVEHGFTHFRLQLALAVARVPGHALPGADGEWWPVDDLGAAGLPTIFARAAQAIRERLA
ncbi:A/G-specific adenine glycosylase [uncultured Sphingomonas sp.]|uniref:A/G-specific adenine glycosylase n=1 Tax=uncultured Sphingomonas sp. TaxID=158754 RepID=UPI0035C977A5